MWCTLEFGMMEIGDDFANISSLMPQKKNSLVFEYIRARAAGVAGDLQSASMMVHNTCFQDTEDICIDVEFPIAHAAEQSLAAVRLFAGILTTLVVKPERMLALANQGFSTASALAYAIQRATGLSYRTAHRVVARTVLLASEHGLLANQITAELVDEAARDSIGRSLQLDGSLIAAALDASSFVRGIKVTGGPQPGEVDRMLAESAARLETDERLRGHGQKDPPQCNDCGGSFSLLEQRRAGQGLLSSPLQPGPDCTLLAG